MRYLGHQLQLKQLDNQHLLWGEKGGAKNGGKVIGCYTQSNLAGVFVDKGQTAEWLLIWSSTFSTYIDKRLIQTLDNFQDALHPDWATSCQPSFNSHPAQWLIAHGRKTSSNPEQNRAFPTKPSGRTTEASLSLSICHFKAKHRLGFTEALSHTDTHSVLDRKRKKKRKTGF